MEVNYYRQSNVGNLPNELLLYIFEMLSLNEIELASKVCRKWHKLTSRIFFTITNQNDLTRLADGPIITIKVLKILVKIPKPETLLSPLCTLAKNLQYLIIQAETPLCLSHIITLTQLPHLKHLDVFMVSGVLDSDVAKELKMPLQSLVLNNCVQKSFLKTFLYGNGRKNIKEVHMYGKCRFFPKSELKALINFYKLELTSMTFRCADLNTQCYLEVFNCLNLESLRLYECWNLNDKVVFAICKLLNLKVLHMTGSRMLRKQGLLAFLVSSSFVLSELVLSSSCFSDYHIGALSFFQPHLRRLELWKCKLSSKGFVELVMQLPELREVDVDIKLSNKQLSEIDTHPSLTFIRCFTPRGYVNSKVVDANVKVAGNLLFGSGEGLRASLYYHWLQDAPLELLFSIKP